MYVHEAKNLAEGRPYIDTGYIYNPATPRYGPRTYPPIFPLMLAPAYRLFGLNLRPMKMEQIVFILAALAAMYMLWWPELGHGLSLALVAILGFNPKLWAAKDEVTSDLLFLFLFYLAALVIERAPHESSQWWRSSLLAGLLLYLAAGTRTIGNALGLGMLLYGCARHKRRAWFAALAATVWGACAFLQWRWIGHGEASYLDHFHPTLRATLENMRVYGRALAAFWTASIHNQFSLAVLAMVAVLGIVGLRARLQHGLAVVEYFLAPYLVVLLLFPHAIGIRGAWPLLAWTVFLALSGLRCLTAPSKHAIASTCALLALIAATYIQGYRNADFGPIREQDGLPEFNELCGTIRQNTAPGDVLIFYRARALSLYTERPASTYNPFGTDRELWHWIGDIHATYIVTTDAFNEDGGYLKRFVNNYSGNLAPAFHNAAFTLYRITAGSRESLGAFSDRRIVAPAGKESH
jgi:hypothetical protein